jgi:[ribosomal protein S5]-alanine N-acetyltransferase
MPYPKIIGEKVYLRTIEPSDLERCLKWINDPEVTRFLASESMLFNSIREEDWIRNLYKSDSDFPFAICLREGDVHIGNLRLGPINRLHGISIFGILIGDAENRGRGFGTEATKLILDYAFNVQNQHRVELGVFIFNERAIACYEKAGFIREGVQRKKYFKEGRYHDQIVMGILRDDWLERK